MVEPITVRDYTPDDYAMLQAWWSARGYPHIPSAVFPPDCYIAELKGSPVAFQVFYLSLGIGVAFTDFLVSRPRTGPKIIGAAFDAITMEFEKRHGGLNAYTMIRGFVYDPLARHIGRAGYMVGTRQGYEALKEVGL